MCVNTDGTANGTDSEHAHLVRVSESIHSGLQAEPGHETEVHAVEALGHADLLAAALVGCGRPDVLRRVDRLQSHLRTAARSHREAQSEALREAAQFVEAIQTALADCTPEATETGDTSVGDSPLDEPAGHALVTVDVDETTHETLREAYVDAVAAGYTERFNVFTLNHTYSEYRLTVDGEPVEPADG
jgi:hypothetical protein